MHKIFSFKIRQRATCAMIIIIFSLVILTLSWRGYTYNRHLLFTKSKIDYGSLGKYSDIF